MYLHNSTVTASRPFPIPANQHPLERKGIVTLWRRFPQKTRKKGFENEKTIQNKIETFHWDVLL